LGAVDCAGRGLVRVVDHGRQEAARRPRLQGLADPALTIDADGVKLDLNGHTIISGETTGFKITDSVANRNGTAGFNIGNTEDPRDYTVNNNTANDNDQYGFFAAKRVRHSAGNRASGNGVEDCHKVNCV
jgi:hypothetical protein